MINPLHKVEIAKYELFHPNVGGADGLVIAQLSDIHMGRWVKPRHLRQLVEWINETAPDLVALTGDYVGYNKRDVDRCVDELDQLSAPSFAVLGNHDHWTDGARAQRAFNKSSIALMSNESVLFADDRLRLVGVDDQVTGNADVGRAFGDVGGARFCLTLNHVPSIAPDCVGAGADLVLSGHTHNFQFNIPAVTNALATRLGAKYCAGPYRIDDSYLYINRGLGSASWPRRIRSLPEITYITLRHSDDHIRLELVESMFRAVEHRRRA